ncbi:MAG TPA: DUF202 domain-containing protein [Acidimicrobiales bacterium]|nr:DUF202 domain-containing protein [Acidimicrobiales bacterium]
MSADDDGLAIERTALAWQRTGLSHMAAGALFLRLLPVSPARAALASSLIAIGVVISIGSRRMHPGTPHRRSIALVGAATTGAAAVGLVLSFA